MSDGTAAAPAFAFKEALDTGMYRSASGKIGFSVGGVGKAFIGGTTVSFVDNAGYTYSPPVNTSFSPAEGGNFIFNSSTGRFMSSVDDVVVSSQDHPLSSLESRVAGTFICFTGSGSFAASCPSGLRSNMSDRVTSTVPIRFSGTTVEDGTYYFDVGGNMYGVYYNTAGHTIFYSEGKQVLDVEDSYAITAIECSLEFSTGGTLSVGGDAIYSAETSGVAFAVDSSTRGLKYPANIVYDSADILIIDSGDFAPQGGFSVSGTSSGISRLEVTNGGSSGSPGLSFTASSYGIYVSAAFTHSFVIGEAAMLTFDDTVVPEVTCPANALFSGGDCYGESTLYTHELLFSADAVGSECGFYYNTGAPGELAVQYGSSSLSMTPSSISFNCTLVADGTNSVNLYGVGLYINSLTIYEPPAASDYGFVIDTNDYNRIYHSTSSIKYKENVVALNYPVEKVLYLEPVSFDYKTKTGRRFGLIAEEVEKICPWLVRYDSCGELSYVAYQKIFIYMIPLGQELFSRVNDLFGRFSFNEGSTPFDPAKAMADLRDLKRDIEPILSLEDRLERQNAELEMRVGKLKLAIGN
jgi:hypothetical protein